MYKRIYLISLLCVSIFSSIFALEKDVIPACPGATANRVPSLKFLAAHTMAHNYKYDYIAKAKMPADLKEYVLTIEPHGKNLSAETTQNILADAIIKNQLTKQLLADIYAVNPRVIVNPINQSGHGLLHYAAKAQDYDLIDFLLQQGADANATTDELNESVLMTFIDNLCGCQNHIQKDILELLIAYGADINKRNKNGDTPLMCAILRKQLFVVQELLKQGAALDDRNAVGETALIGAVTLNDCECVNLLLAHKPNLELCCRMPYNSYDGLSDELLWRNYDYENAFLIASRNKNYEIMNLLREAGANINITSSAGTALHHAVAYEDLELARALLEMGVDIHMPAPGRFRGTALQAAVSLATTKNKIAMINLLLDYKARITPEVLIAALKDTKALSLLAKKSSNIDALAEYENKNAYMNAVCERNFDAIRVLKEAGANINTVGEFDYRTSTALDYAISKHDTELVKFLLNLGCSIEVKDRFERTLLMHAAEIGNADIVALLLSAGANPNATLNGYTALDSVFRYYENSSYQNRLSIISLLIDRTDRVNMPYQSNFLNHLLQGNNYDLIKKLLDKGLYNSLQKYPEWHERLLKNATPDMRIYCNSYRVQPPWYQRAYAYTKELVKNRPKLLFGVAGVLMGFARWYSIKS